MKYMLESIKVIALRLNRAGVFIAELALMALMLVTVYAVFTRYVLESPSVHALEVSQYLLLVTSWMSIGWVLIVGRHVRMEALYNILPDMMKKVADIIVWLAIFIFCGVLVWSGSVNVITAFERGYRSSSLLNFPKWIPFSLIPVGGVLLLLSGIYLLLKDRSKD
jgi:TRAP-type C4-dicarboxylate transport system permease small subunit